jgi:predicted Zn finger-like uncharacterized protein
MILTCPNCGTQYVVKDGAIPPEGRQVRCAACKHSWHQAPDIEGSVETETVAPPEAAAVAPGIVEPVAAEGAPLPAVAEETPLEEESFAEAALIDPSSGPEAEERAYEEAMIESGGEAAAIEDAPQAEPVQDVVETVPAHAETVAEDWREPPEPEAAPDTFSPFAEADDVEPRRRSPLIAILLVVLLVVAGAAAFYFFAPGELKAKLGVGDAGSSPLALVTTHMDRQRLESGNELLTVTGRVINPTGKEQDVPPLRAQLRSKTGQVVYSWTIAPPARSLPAGASASFNSAEVNVPPGGDELTITLGDPRV